MSLSKKLETKLTLDHFNTAIAIIGCTIIALLLINAIFIVTIVGRHFDKQFPEFVNDKRAFENSWWILNPVFRAGTYCGCIVFKKYFSKRPYMQYYFNGCDFRKSISTLGRTIVFIHFIGAGFILLLGGIMFFANGFTLPPT